MSIEKIRNGSLTEDEKMEIIADYLENGGGGESSKLRIRVKTDYVPTQASELTRVTGTSLYTYDVTDGVTVQDEKGNTVSAADFRAAVESGNVEILSVDTFPSAAVISGNSVTIIPTGNTVTSTSTSTMYNNVTYGAVGTILLGTTSMFAGVGVSPDGDTFGATISVIG